MKAVLVIDVEEKDIGRIANYISVQGDGYSYIVGIMGMDARLRPLPQKKSHKEHSWNAEEIEITNGYEDGWNACIEEIIGEKDESNSNC